MVVAAVATRIDEVKVFSATKAKERAMLGERVTLWIDQHPGIEILSAVLRLSSDREFHCLSIVLICSKRSKRFARLAGTQ